MRIGKIFMTIALGLMSVGLGGCGDDEPDNPDGGGGNQENAGGIGSAKLIISSRSCSSNGSVFSAGETYKFQVEEISMSIGNQEASLKEICFIIDGKPVSSSYDLPAIMTYDKIGSLSAGEHKLEARITGICGKQTAEETVELHKFYVVSQKMEMTMSPTIYLSQYIYGTGDDGQQYADSMEKDYSLTAGEELNLDVEGVASSNFTNTCRIWIDPTKLGIKANFTYTIKDVKVYMLKDIKPDTELNLSLMEPRNEVDFKVTNTQKIGFKTLSIVYSFTYTREIDGMKLPEVDAIQVFKVNVKEK